jgi:hypothetical protein
METVVRDGRDIGRIDTMPQAARGNLSAPWWREVKYLNLCDSQGKPRPLSYFRRSAHKDVEQVLRQVRIAREMIRRRTGAGDIGLRKVTISYFLGSCRQSDGRILEAVRRELLAAVRNAADAMQLATRTHPRIRFGVNVRQYLQN